LAISLNQSYMHLFQIKFYFFQWNRCFQ